jgi:hypothetical protein
MISLTNVNINKFVKLSDLPEPSKETLKQRLGDGGGQHFVFFQGRLSCSDFPKHLENLTRMMLDLFEKKLPDVKITEIYAEHRLYIFDNEPFYGLMHHDRSQYTILCYLDVGLNIVGGELAFYCCDETLDTTIKPKTGDIVIFNGLHSLNKTYASGCSNRRNIWALFVNYAD